MTTQQLRVRIGDLIFRSGRAVVVRSGRASSSLVNIAPEGVRDWLRRWEKDVDARLSYRIKLVPEQAYERVVNALLTELVDLHGADALGDYLEFGVCHGTSMMCMHRTLENLKLSTPRLFGFDSFEGLPDEASHDDDGAWLPGQFDSDYEYTRHLMTRGGVDWDRTTLVKGWFHDTCNDELIARCKIEKASVILIDCDMYASSKTALTFCAPLIRDAAMIMFDDWYAFEGQLADRNLGEKRAFEEFLAENPQFTAEERPAYHENSKAFLVTNTGD
jgi:O-methyltransferase